MKKLLLIVLMALSLQLFSEDYKVVLKKGVTLSQQEINKNNKEIEVFLFSSALELSYIAISYKLCNLFYKARRFDNFAPLFQNFLIAFWSILSDFFLDK